MRSHTLGLLRRLQSHVLIADMLIDRIARTCRAHVKIEKVTFRQPKILTNLTADVPIGDGGYAEAGIIVITTAESIKNKFSEVD